MAYQDAQSPPKLTLQYQWSSSLHAHMKVSQLSQPTDMSPFKSSTSSAHGSITANDGSDIPTSQGDNALDAGMIFLGGHRTRPNWSPQEDFILLQHVARRGTRNWGSLQASGLLPLRDQKACCNRFILLKKRCIKDKRSLSHLLHRAKDSVVAPEASTQQNQIASSSSLATPSFSSHLQLPALSGSSLGLNSNSRPSFKSGSPTRASTITAATAAFNAPSATALPTAVRSPVSLVQQQQQIQQQQQQFQQQQQQKIQQALAGSRHFQQSGNNTSNAALGGENFSGVPLLQMPALNPSTSLSMSVQLANVKSRLALQPGSLLAQALRLTQQPDFASVADLPLLANVRKLAKPSSSSSLTAAASAPAAVGSPPHSSAPSGCSSPSDVVAAFSAASEPFCTRWSSLSSSGRCLSPNALFVAADGSQGNGRLAPVERMPSFDVSSVCTGLPSATAAAGTITGAAAGSASADAEAVVPSSVLPDGSAVSGHTFTGGGGGVEGGGGGAGAAGICADNAFASVPSSSFTALLTSSASVNHRQASMAVPAPVISHTWRPQCNAKCLQKSLPVQSANGGGREMMIHQQQLCHSQQQALNMKLQQQQQQEQISQGNLSEVTRQLAQQEEGKQQVMSQLPDVMLLEAFSSARHTRNESLHCSQNEPQKMLDAGSGDPWGALNTTEDARLANIISSGSLEAVVAGNGRTSEFPLTAFDDQKPVGGADFQSEEAMFSSLSQNGMFAEMPASFSESDMLQAIHAEMEMLSSIVNAS
ncbi:unnamed protein product [Closterium sp. NIES-53]